MKPILQGGAIAFRSNGMPRILLVRGKKDPGKWIFPKGHIESSESDATAAVRELREETGVEGELLGPVGAPLEFQSGDELVRVQYHLVRLTAEGSSPEGREKQWLSVPEAMKQLSFRDARELLWTALPDIERHSVPAEHPSAGDSFREYLLAEYAHVAESLLKSEEDGERRATFFVTLAGALGAAVAFAIGTDRGVEAGGQHPLIIVALWVLLVFGYLTFVRIVSRNVASDDYKRRLNRIRRRFLRGADDPRLVFVPFSPYHTNSRDLGSWTSVGKGGWLETLAFVNAVLVGCLVAVVIARPNWWVNVFVGIVSAALAWVVLIERGNRLYAYLSKIGPAKNET